jgi:Pilus biogenesis CpaD protein (pilus_cpaD)
VSGIEIMTRKKFKLSHLAPAAFLSVATLALTGCIAEDTLYADSYHQPSQATEIYTLQAMKAKKLKCGNWPADLVDTHDNTQYYNYGCAVQSNIATMIADPRTINKPRKADLPSAEQAALAVRNVNSTTAAAGGGGGGGLASLLGSP